MQALPMAAQAMGAEGWMPMLMSVLGLSGGAPGGQAGPPPPPNPAVERPKDQTTFQMETAKAMSETPTAGEPSAFQSTLGDLAQGASVVNTLGSAMPKAPTPRAPNARAVPMHKPSATMGMRKPGQSIAEALQFLRNRR